MTSRTILAMIAAILLSPWTSLAQAEKPPMPPTFTRESDIEKTLRAYPLGVIGRQAAFSHNGKAHREIKLPNSLQG
jgi:hypothetical protein